MTVDSSWGGEGITGGVYWLAVDGIIKGFVTVEFGANGKNLSDTRLQGKEVFPCSGDGEAVFPGDLVGVGLSAVT